jgi:hypothetical protein
MLELLNNIDVASASRRTVMSFYFANTVAGVAA